MHIITACIAFSLVKKTKYNASWILITIGFTFIALYRSIDLFPILIQQKGEVITLIQRWLGFVISLVLVIGVFYIRKIFKFLKDLDLIRERSEQKLLSAVIRTEENERKRFAKELHDGIGPLLSVAKMLLSGISYDKTSDMNTKIVDNTSQVIDEAIVTVREISASLSPHTLNHFGLKIALESLINKLKPVKDLTFNFETNIGKSRINYNIEVIIYRVLCELINNTIKHADATLVNIVLNLDKPILHIEYSDNGIGFNSSSNSIISNGIGLDNIINRLESVNGDIELQSEEGKGMKAIIDVSIVAK
ncbi:sensor histidine kinase [Marinilabiliaceae bacterium JC040]|jgi:signal transduction histidine kinase|nr:sensor histidine kinase [Marinilabiliaceae bacterium JC040]